MNLRRRIILPATGALLVCGVVALALFVRRDGSSRVREPDGQLPARQVAFATAGGAAEPQARPAGSDSTDHGWPDRRPLGVIMFSDRAKVTDANPDGWIDAARPDPERLIDTCVRRAAELDAQAAIFWDVEGSRYDVPVTYVGDPRVVAPGRSIDQLRRWSRRFTDRGVKVGGTIRPQVLIVTKDGPRQYRSPDYYGSLAAKISWARETLGWTTRPVEDSVEDCGRSLV